MPYLAKIVIYPIKSLDGVEVAQAEVLSSGALKGDREFALFDVQSKFVNGKRHPKIHLLRADYQNTSGDQTISLKIPHQDSPLVFNLNTEREKLTAALSDFFGFSLTIAQNSLMGFPDDTDSPGPTVISTATLTEVASWFPGVTVDEMRRRIRANIEIAGVPAFWEDHLFSEPDQLVALRVGNVQFFGVNPCQRCVVPTRNPDSAAVYPSFQKIFIQQRQATLPDSVNLSHFNHFYRLSVNTRVHISESGKILQIGDEIEIIPDIN
ncbi:MOSC N-terminal beta barrel domain-containing protein [Nostoc sp. FACHB-87]|uniref:MOSC domain-containing protein n=1 Tax=Nostocales TaxID=1161 RepID=UPI0016830405|nr:MULTISPECIES: MOSC N-terminal beta barrel domain-containing protein [Nostocales]MBD2297890.1 MOSC N-terminal beta barrel domain-containing protein [Nostoc sp. FACHB-190]MBD2457955.1 MOSC N-terminal beta barrel domain-containing protein [Nostoc sp. FACHB-87]MBD2479128.1 MOSC N-terminal beta barrel domain-containing protein [Anabaena sp. FACHB-83]MBD2489798.1 MOSC N-terminal beta barrel domain-containing protein [Aulosira sp. FACHB-615]